MPEEQYPEKHVQESLLVPSHEKSDLTEDILEIDQDHVNDSAATESQMDDTLVIRKSLERGESLPISDEVCNIYESKHLSNISFKIHFIQFDNPFYTKTQGIEMLENKDSVDKSQKLSYHSQTTPESLDTHAMKSIDDSVADLDTCQKLVGNTQISPDEPDLMTETSTEQVSSFQSNEEVIMHEIIEPFNFWKDILSKYV